MQRIFISDLHLAEIESPPFQSFLSLLRHHIRHVDALYILGDLFEVWVGDDDDAPVACALRDALSEASRYTKIYLIHGNRDFLIGTSFASACGITLLDDPHRLDEHTMLAHGDQFCVDDIAYQETRRTLRSSQWQQQIMSLSITERRTLAHDMREQSRAANANKPANIMDANPNEVTRLMAQSRANRLIHGHTHRPGKHSEPWGIRYVLGPWEHCGWLLRQRGTSDPQLECFPLVDRCET